MSGLKNALPQDISKIIEQEAEAHNTRLKELAESEKEVEYAQGFAEGWGEGATAYASKLQVAEEQHKLLIKTLLELEEGKRKELQQENAELKAHNDRLKIALGNVYRIHGHQWSEYDINVIKELIK